MDKSARNYPLEDIDRETMFHPNTSIVDHLKKGPHILAQARGVRIKEHGGRELIDCGAGLWCVNIGYGRKEMAEAAKKAIENLAYYHIFGGASNEPIIRLAERVIGLFHDKAQRNSRRSSSAPAARMPTTPTSSWSATTTTCGESPKRRRSSPGSAPITA